MHVSGAKNLLSDHASRNAPECLDEHCQVCSFVHHSEDTTIFQVSVQDILRGTSRLPYTNRQSWLSIQSDCPDLRRTCAHLKQGTRPSRKLTNVTDVKRYLNNITLAQDGLLVVKVTEPLSPVREKIVVPRMVLEGLLTALHLHLNHPSSHQMRSVVSRYFFALNLNDAIERTCTQCHQCASLKTIPAAIVTQSSNDPPRIGWHTIRC